MEIFLKVAFSSYSWEFGFSTTTVPPLNCSLFSQFFRGICLRGLNFGLNCKKKQKVLSVFRLAQKIVDEKLASQNHETILGAELLEFLNNTHQITDFTT